MVIPALPFPIPLVSPRPSDTTMGGPFSAPTISRFSIQQTNSQMELMSSRARRIISSIFAQRFHSNFNAEDEKLFSFSRCRPFRWANRETRQKVADSGKSTKRLHNDGPQRRSAREALRYDNNNRNRFYCAASHRRNRPACGSGEETRGERRAGIVRNVRGQTGSALHAKRT